MSRNPYKKALERYQQHYKSSIQTQEILKFFIAQQTQNISAKFIEDKEKNQIKPKFLQYKQPQKVEPGQIGWSEQNKNRKDSLGETKYITQIGAGNITDMSKSKNLNLINWFSKGMPSNNDQQKKQTNKKTYDNPSLDFLTMKNINYVLNSIFNTKIEMPKFPNPIVKYKIIPYMDERKTLESASKNDFINGYKKNNLMINNYYGGPHQLFYIKQAHPSTYYIINVAKGFAVRLPNASSKQDAPAYTNFMTQKRFKKLNFGDQSPARRCIQYSQWVNLDMYQISLGLKVLKELMQLQVKTNRKIIKNGRYIHLEQILYKWVQVFYSFY